MATSIGASPLSLFIVMTLLCKELVELSKNLMKSERPPLNLNVSFLSSSPVVSTREISNPLFRYASSLKRSAIRSKSQLLMLKISSSGINVIFVPVFFVFPIISIFVFVLPRSYLCLCTCPSL